MRGTVVGRSEGFFKVMFDDVPARQVFEQLGSMPLPPYINRPATKQDEERYQTIFADQAGAVAAPTAGLHFTDSLMQDIAAKGVETGLITLHVGAGTFQPIRDENFVEHQMHSERFSVSQSLVEKVQHTRDRGKRVVAVGTTVARTLESVALDDGQIEARQGSTNIFIYPGYQFKVVDCLVTNFHLPKSSLLLMVSAFSGNPEILNAYYHAIENDYRFFSYGDAMFLHRKS